MKACGILKFAAGYAAGVAATAFGYTALEKIVAEMKRDMKDEQILVSPEGNHRVSMVYGSSETAKGLTCIKIKITAEEKDDECKLVVFSRKRGDFVNAVSEWSDNDHFHLLVGNGKRRQCWDVSFEEDQITALYYFRKIDC